MNRSIVGNKQGGPSVYGDCGYTRACRLMESETAFPAPLPALMAFTDFAFIIYWVLVISSAIPDEYLFKDYKNPLMVDWNYSFLPLDLLVSITGLQALRFWARRSPDWLPWCFASLILTFCSGLQALAFWAVHADYDPLWWGANLFLMIYPGYFLSILLKLDAWNGSGFLEK